MGDDLLSSISHFKSFKNMHFWFFGSWEKLRLLSVFVIVFFLLRILRQLELNSRVKKSLLMVKQLISAFGIQQVKRDLDLSQKHILEMLLVVFWYFRAQILHLS
uniref:Uncharacterized protein n=1 Tax=Coptotermes formosanus TaxID=36987 RepID=R4V3I1_COPFO|nr:hypothetical protein [Coptotermes formosanus]